jgi:hypothetical protein
MDKAIATPRKHTQHTHSTYPALPIADSPPPRKRRETHPEDPVCNSPQQRNPPPRPIHLPSYLPRQTIPIPIPAQSSPIHCTLGPSPALSHPTLSLRLPSTLCPTPPRPDSCACSSPTTYLGRHARPLHPHSSHTLHTPHPAFLNSTPTPCACAWWR